MKVDLFTFVDLHRRLLDTAAHLLVKGLAFARAKGVPEEDMLGNPDMLANRL